jgi:hypothetical protein
MKHLRTIFFGGATLLSCASLLSACHQRQKAMSFYYWRTVFSIDTIETVTLKDNNVHTLYVRYFDVDWPPEDSSATPVSPIQFTTEPTGYSIVPVVFLRNRVFEKLAPASIPAFTSKIKALIERISQSHSIRPDEVQFDCDWTQRTKNSYFSFLRAYHDLSAKPVSCTIRLHQVKYPDQTGIPPVDHGVLMYYNMGNIDAGGGSSIYEKSIAHRYTPSLRSYPLSLDLALPVFSWGLLVRDGKVVQLLDKMSATLFDGDTCFTRLSRGWYSAKDGCFKSGYYFQHGDNIKIESVSADDLREIVTDVNRHTNHHIQNVLFFDLDRQNILLYDKDLFKELLAHTD